MIEPSVMISNINFSWSWSGENIVSNEKYEFYFMKAGDSWKRKAVGLTSSEFTLNETLLPGEKYFWKVAVYIGSINYTVNEIVWSFNTAEDKILLVLLLVMLLSGYIIQITDFK